jgi:hypothetical protein
MSTSLRILAVSALLIVGATMFAGLAGAASLDVPLPIAKAAPNATQPVYWRERRWTGRRYSWRAPSELIAGVRGASPLTVPFYGYGWYPGPAYYYGPRPVPCCHAGADVVISVRY